MHAGQEGIRWYPHFLPFGLPVREPSGGTRGTLRPWVSRYSFTRTPPLAPLVDAQTTTMTQSAFESLEHAVKWLDSVVYSNCDRPTVTHDVTDWMHTSSNVASRVLPCVMALSDPYLQVVLKHWCGDVHNPLTLCRYLILEPLEAHHQHHRLRVVSGEVCAEVGLRAPQCTDVNRRMALIRRVDKKWLAHSQSVATCSKPVVLLCEYAWLHLTHPADMRGYRVHLAAPLGWFSNNEVLALRPGTTTSLTRIRRDADASLELRPTGDVIEHLRTLCTMEEQSILSDMQLVSAKMAYHCVKDLYCVKSSASCDPPPLEWYLHAHFECPANWDDDEDPSHVRVRRAATAISSLSRCHDVGAAVTTYFSLNPSPARDTDDCEPYQRLLYALRSVFCSAAYRVRHASANIAQRHLILPFGNWIPTVETHTNGSASGLPRVNHPYGWPVVVCIDRQCTVPSVSWCTNVGAIHRALGGGESLFMDSTVRDIEEVYARTLCLSTVHDIVAQTDPPGGFALLVLGGNFIHAESSIRQQHLCLVVLLLVCGHGPLCRVDEVVSIATLVLDALAADNRTFDHSHLTYVAQAHERSWLRFWGAEGDSASLNPHRSDIDSVVTAALLHDPRDRIAYSKGLPRVQERAAPARRRRRSSSTLQTQPRHHNRVSAEDISRLRVASAEMKRISRKEAKCRQQTKAKKIKKYGVTVSSTRDALLYRVARKQCTATR